MLAPRASSAFVCIRCELGLARPRLPLLTRRAPHASFSTSHRRRDAFDDEFAQDKPQPKLSEHPLGRVRKRRGGRAVRELTARLEGTKTLGEDAAILVLQEVEGRSHKEEITEPQIIPETGAQESLRIAEALADEKPATLEEIVEQLDRIRPKSVQGEASTDEGHYISQSLFIKLSGHLLRAFSAQQLSHYYSVRKGVEKENVIKEVMQGVKQLQRKAKRPAERSEWTPGTTQINRRLPGLDLDPKPKKRVVPKHLLVDQILRDVWNLVMLEEIESAGELELVLKDWQLALLTSGTPETALDRIGKARMAKIDFHAADKVLRITADKHTAEYAADDVEQLLQQSERRVFSPKKWLPHLEGFSKVSSIYEIMSEEDLRTVASMTGAYIEPSTHTFIIRALDKDTAAEAIRCLIKLMPLKEPRPHTVDTSALETLEKSQHFLPVPFEKEAVPFRKRNAKLGRWSLPVNQVNTPLLESHEAVERVKAVQEHVINMVTTPARQYEPNNSSSSGFNTNQWADRLDTRFKANFGQALFNLDAFAADSSSEKPFFLPVLPGLSKVFSDESFKMRYTTRPSLCYEFTAEPGETNYTPARYPYLIPTLKVYFRPDNHGQHSLRDVSLEFGTAKHHVLLPEEAVDIEFHAAQSLSMIHAATSSTMLALQRHVLENLQNGARLSAPDIELDIPRWTVGGFDSEHLDKSWTVKYICSGIRFSQSVWGEYMDRSVSYATKQSGKLGAKSGMFSIVYGLDDLAKKTTVKDPATEMKEFIADAFKMARKITEAAASSSSWVKRVKRQPNKRSNNVKSTIILEDEMPVSDIRREEFWGENKTAQTLDGQDVPATQTLSDESVITFEQSTEEHDIIDQPTENNTDATSAPTENSSAVDTQIPSGTFADPYLSSALNDTPLDSYEEGSKPERKDESAEGKQKRCLDSTA